MHVLHKDRDMLNAFIEMIYKHFKNLLQISLHLVIFFF